MVFDRVKACHVFGAWVVTWVLVGRRLVVKLQGGVNVYTIRRPLRRSGIKVKRLPRCQMEEEPPNQQLPHAQLMRNYTVLSIPLRHATPAAIVMGLKSLSHHGHEHIVQKRTGPPTGPHIICQHSYRYPNFDFPTPTKAPARNGGPNREGLGYFILQRCFGSIISNSEPVSVPVGNRTTINGI